MDFSFLLCIPYSYESPLFYSTDILDFLLTCRALKPFASIYSAALSENETANGLVKEQFPSLLNKPLKCILI